MGCTILHTQPPAGSAGAAAGTTLPVDPRSASAPVPNRCRVRPGREISAEAVVLLRMAQAGDRDAFAALYRAFADNVRRYIWVRMRDRDRDAVPDLVQDTFCAALDELDRAHDDVRGWLIQLAAKMCTRYCWAQRRHRRAVLTTGEQQRSHANTVAVPTAAPTLRLIAQALAELDPAERLTVQLRFLDGQSREVTARLMQCTPWTVRQLQKRALHRLATQLLASSGQALQPATTTR
jgi:RNA polymerase sigma-70 factor (ECF subfamily)